MRYVLVDEMRQGVPVWQEGDRDRPRVCWEARLGATGTGWSMAWEEEVTHCPVWQGAYKNELGAIFW